MTPEEKAAYMREYNARPENREKKRQRDREYGARNREAALARASQYYLENTEKVKSYQRQRRQDRKARVAAILGSVCERCGFDHLAALDFHHKDQSTKLFNIGDVITRTRKYTWEQIEDEVRKCELICKNCHAVEHCNW